MRFEPTEQDIEEKLLELAYQWGDVEREMEEWGRFYNEGFSALFHAVQKAYLVEVMYDENDFGDPCTPYVLYFDVTNEEARSAAARVKATYGQSGKSLTSFINEVADSWHTKYNFTVKVVAPGTRGNGVVCRRLNEQHPPGAMPTLADVPDEKSSSSVQMVKKDGYWLTPLEVPFYDALRETGLFFSVQPWIQGTDRKYRLDFLVFYDGGCIAIELDSFGYHKSKQEFTRDRQRDRWFSERRVKTLRWTYDEVMANPQSCVRELLDNLRGVHARP